MNNVKQFLTENKLSILDEVIYFQILDVNHLHESSKNVDVVPKVLAIRKDSKDRYSLVNCTENTTLASDNTWKDTNNGLTLVRYFNENEIIKYIKDNYVICKN